MNSSRRSHWKMKASPTYRKKPMISESISEGLSIHSRAHQPHVLTSGIPHEQPSSTNRVQRSPADFFNRARQRQAGRRARARKIHSPGHHRAHLEGVFVRERQVARAYTKHLQRADKAQWPEPPQMAAINAAHTNEASQSYWQRLRRG